MMWNWSMISSEESGSFIDLRASGPGWDPCLLRNACDLIGLQQGDLLLNHGFTVSKVGYPISDFTEYCDFVFSCSSAMGIPIVQLFSHHDFITCWISLMHTITKVINIEINVKLIFLSCYILNKKYQFSLINLANEQFFNIMFLFWSGFCLKHLWKERWLVFSSFQWSHGLAA